MQWHVCWRTCTCKKNILYSYGRCCLQDPRRLWVPKRFQIWQQRQKIVRFKKKINVNRCHLDKFQAILRYSLPSLCFRRGISNFALALPLYNSIVPLAPLTIFNIFLYRYTLIQTKQNEFICVHEKPFITIYLQYCVC